MSGDGDEIQRNRHPGPGARLVGRPRVSMILFASSLLFCGVLAIVGSKGPGLFPGLCMAAPGAYMLAGTLWMRVWVDGSVLIVRNLQGWHGPLRLDALRSGDALDGGPYSAREIVLHDSYGCEVRIAPMIVRLARLYRLLGNPDVVGVRVLFDDDLSGRIEMHRPRRWHVRGRNGS